MGSSASRVVGLYGSVLDSLFPLNQALLLITVLGDCPCSRCMVACRATLGQAYDAPSP